MGPTAQAGNTDRPRPSTVTPATDSGNRSGDGVPAADAPLRLRVDPRIAPARRIPQDQKPTYGRSDRMNSTGGPGESVTVLQGNAELRQLGTRIRADRIQLQEAEQRVQAEGGVTIDRDGSRISGPSMELMLDDGTGHVDSPTYWLAGGGGRGTASRLDLLGDGRYRMRQATFTTCRPDNEDWRIEARRLEIDDVEGEGSGRNARLVFMDRRSPNVPAFFFPIGDERKSGFLSPTFSVNSRTGAEVAVPYYFNLAPNYDLTLTPTASLRRGLLLASDFRYLFRPMRGELHHEYVPRDTVTGLNRYYFNATNAVSDIGGWSGGWNFKGVSDDNYFVDFSRNIIDASERSLPRDVFATRNFGDWNFLARVTKYQNILDARLVPPYERLPQLRLSNFTTDVGGFDFSLVNDLTWFQRPLAGSAEGLRAVVNPGVSYPMRGSYWFVTPRASLNLATYQLQANPLGPETISRAVPTVSLDSGLVMERQMRWQGRDMTQTLEPRLFYARSGYRDQSRIPVFDSFASDFNFVQLFNENPYSGYDRIADVNQLTAALLSRFIDGPTGAERLRLAIGQRYYFSEERVTLPGVRPRTENNSDLLLAASADLGNGHGFDAGMQYGLTSRDLPRYTAVYRYWPRERDRLFNAGVYFQSGQYAQWSTSWQWPISRRWNTLGKFNYSYLGQAVNPFTGDVFDVKKGLVEAVLGLEYNEDCWSTRFVAQRFVTAAGRYTSAFFVQLDLRGLGRIGTDPFTILIRNIPGYRIPDNRVAPSPTPYGYP